MSRRHALLHRALASKALWRVLALLVACELLATSPWLALGFDRRPGHLEFALAALATPLIAIIAFLCGGRAEQRGAWFTRLSTRYEGRRPYYETVRISGDPTLGRRLEAMKPSRPFAALASAKEMSAWREEVRRDITNRLYEEPFGPQNNPPRIQVVRELDVDKELSRAFVTYEASDGTTIPAYIFHARGKRQLPGVLVVPGAGRGIVETAGIVKSYQHGAALALARAGFVTFTPELRGFGHLGEAVGTDPARVGRKALLIGSSYYAVLIHDLRRGFTAFLGHPSVDASRVAVSGCSLGGDLAITLGAVDTRVTAVVAQGLCHWHGERGQRPRPEDDGSELRGDASSIVPGAAGVTHYEDRFLLLAPRPFAIVDGTRDVVDGTRQVGYKEEESWLLEVMRSAYQVEGAADCFEFIVARGGHEYHLDPAIAFLRRHLLAMRAVVKRPSTPVPARGSARCRSRG